MASKKTIKLLIGSISLIGIFFLIFCIYCSQTHQYIYKSVAQSDATCISDGSVTYACFFGDQYTEIIPALGHTYDTITLEPTCTTEGSTIYTCSVCSDSYEENMTALGHSYESMIVEPTCTSEGITTYTCSVCGDSYEENTPALDHTYESTIVEATCTTEGGTTYTCSVCGDSYQEDIIPALGHTYGDWIVTAEATAQQNGSQQHTCSICGYVETQELKLDTDAIARSIASQIATAAKADSELQTIKNAAQMVSAYYKSGTHKESGQYYNTAYGVFVVGESSCAGTTRALGMVLECLGYSWTHINENQWAHQWCELVVDGNTIYADGQVGWVGNVPHPYYSMIN
ncbi:MAG: hypothetical protein R3Y24_09930 [Eubacteriales bacterium]